MLGKAANPLVVNGIEAVCFVLRSSHGKFAPPCPALALLQFVCSDTSVNHALGKL